MTMPPKSQAAEASELQLPPSVLLWAVKTCLPWKRHMIQPLKGCPRTSSMGNLDPDHQKGFSSPISQPVSPVEHKAMFVNHKMQVSDPTSLQDVLGSKEDIN